MTRFSAFSLLLAWLPLTAWAASAPVTYMRTSLAIIVLGPAVPNQPPEVEKLLSVDVDVRSSENFRHQEGWFSLGSLGVGRGVLVLEAAPATATLERREQYAPLDVLWLTEDGTIAQILPGLVLSDLAKPINAAQPVLATLYLRGGAASNLGIKPGDKVEYPAFRKNPIVLGAQPAAKAPELLLNTAAPVRGVTLNDLLENQKPVKKPVKRQ